MHSDTTAVTVQSKEIVSNEVKDNQALLEPSYRNKPDKLLANPICDTCMVWITFEYFEVFTFLWVPCEADVYWPLFIDRLTKLLKVTELVNYRSSVLNGGPLTSQLKCSEREGKGMPAMMAQGLQKASAEASPIPGLTRKKNKKPLFLSSLYS